MLGFKGVGVLDLRLYRILGFRAKDLGLKGFVGCQVQDLGLKSLGFQSLTSWGLGSRIQALRI